MPPTPPSPTHVYLRVGYGWNESTNLACAIADLANRSQLSVQISTTLPHVTGVHDTWDNRLAGMPVSLPRGSATIWFEPQRHAIARAAHSGHRNILVCRHAGQIAEFKAVEPFVSDIVVCDPDYLRPFVASGKARCIPSYCSVLEPYRAPYPRPDDCLWLVDSATLRKYGGSIAHMLVIMLSFNPKLRISFVRQGTCDAAADRLLRDAARKYTDRLRIYTRASRQQRQVIYRECGWGVVLSCQDTGVTYLVEAIKAGLFVAGLNYGGAQEIFSSLFGWPIACGVAYNQYGIPHAEIDQASLLEALLGRYEQIRIYSDEFASLDSSKIKARLAERRSRFEAGWRNLWYLT